MAGVPMSELERFFSQQQYVRLLESIEAAAWSIAVLLLIIGVAVLFSVRRGRAQRAEPSWNEIVEKAYEAGQYEKALQTLASCELHFPRSATVKYWQGRCHFQQEAWENAVEKFEACCRLEPPYRKYVRDYMAFIELNELVPGLTGYLDRGKESA
jgi:hypothetical protein